MRPRSELLEFFSTFLQFESDRTERWMTDARLRRNMQRCLAATPDLSAQDSETGDRFWVAYWHQQWRRLQDQFSLAHLSAYLQETCYWAAYRMTRRFSGMAGYLADYFQIAILEVPKILNHCRLESSSSLSAYASQAFGNFIRDHLRQRREIDLCSDWGLLLKISQKRLQEALTQAGLSSEIVQRYLLSWRCFTQLYVPSAPQLNQLARPAAETWQAIADRYNQLRSPTDPAMTPEVLEQGLLYAVRQTRAYLYPTVTSLNQPRFQSDTEEWSEFLPDEAQNPLEQAIVQEDWHTRQQQQAQLHQVLQVAIGNLEPSMQELLRFYYGEHQTQQQIAQALDVKQYAVSRKLAKVREILLQALAKWSQETLHIVPTSIVLSTISIELEEWLQTYYQPPEA